MQGPNISFLTKRKQTPNFGDYANKKMAPNPHFGFKRKNILNRRKVSANDPLRKLYKKQEKDQAVLNVQEITL